MRSWKFFSLKVMFTFCILSGWKVYFKVYRVTDFEFVKSFYFLFTLRLCLLMEIFFFGNARAYLIDLRPRRSFLSPQYLTVGRSFLRRISGPPPRSRKNVLSLGWMPGSILKLKSEGFGVSFQSNLLWMSFLLCTLPDWR